MEPASFPLIRDSAKCIKCMRCVQVCDKVQKPWMSGTWKVQAPGLRSMCPDTRTIEAADCSLCGQCITHCPVGALTARDDTEKVWDAIADKNKVVVAQVAPAVRAAWGEETWDCAGRTQPVGKILDALKTDGSGLCV